ncbi:MAG: MFS transporter [Bdellovibrionales bacterium]
MDDSNEREKVLNPTVVKLGLVSLFADISSEMLYPITPIFLTTVLGASMASLGLIEGVAESLASLLKTYAGAWSDRIGRRKPFVVWGYLLSGLAKPMIGFSSVWPEVLLARGLDRTGKALRAGPRDALLSDSVNANILGEAFGWHRAMDTLGAAIGPLLAILYLHYYSENLRGIFMWALLPASVAVALTLSVREARTAPAKMIATHKPRWIWKEISPAFRNYLVTWGIFSLSNSSDVFLILRTQQSGVSLQTTIFIYCFYNLIYALASPSLGKLSDGVGRKPLLIFGFLIFAFVYCGFAVATDLWQFWLLFGVYGFYMAATDGVGKALAVDLVDSERKAAGLGMLGTVTGVTTLFASSVAGLLWDHFGSSTTFLFGAGGALLAAASLARISNTKQN